MKINKNKILLIKKKQTPFKIIAKLLVNNENMYLIFTY